MSNDKSRDALSDAPIPQRNNSAEVVKTGSPLDYVLWAIALILLVGALMTNNICQLIGHQPMIFGCVLG